MTVPGVGGRPVATVLLDIDGTLATASSAHHLAMSRAAAAVGLVMEFTYRGESVELNGSPVTGWPDAQCFRFAAAPAELSAGALHALMSDYGDHYDALAAGGADLGRAVPRARWAVATLRAAGLPVALVTGNAHRIAARKLAAVDLADGFRFWLDGGFGDWRADRRALVRAALAGADPRHAVVVGDAVNDMQAAVACGAVGVGVLTGSADESALRAAGAVEVLASVADLPDALGLPPG